MTNKNFIHAMELGILLGLSTSSFAYAMPATSDYAPEITHTQNWTFKASDAPQIDINKQSLLSAIRPLNLPITLAVSAQSARHAVSMQTAHTQDSYNRFSISTSLIPESSRWYIQAKASTRIQSNNTESRYHVGSFNLNTPPYKYEDYVVFPDIVKTGIPILAPALEVGLNKMVRRRLKKTAERYGPYLAARQLDIALSRLNGEDQFNHSILGEYSIESMNEPNNERDEFLNQSLATSFNDQAFGAARFDFNQSDDMSSVLAYYKAARKNPSVRVSGEIGYKSERLNWRLGGQRQKRQSVTDILVNEQNETIYSALNFKLSERMTYFNVTARETSKNSFGITDLSMSRKTDYHRLNYNLSDDFSVFAAQGKIAQDMLGTTQSTQIGVKNCWAPESQFSFCGSLGHQSTKFHESNSEKLTQDSSGYMALMTFKITL
jgi:hypothetical protein